MVAIEVFTELLVTTLILMCWSLLYRENVFYRIAENLTVGCFFGYTLYFGLRTLYEKTFIPLCATGDPSLIIVTVLGIILLLRLVPKVKWVSRLSIAAMTGIAMAIGIRGAISAQIIKQVTMESWATGDILTITNNIIVAVFAFSTIMYFIFTREHRGAQGVIARIGRIALMVLFGAILGTFFMANISFAIAQIPTLVTGVGVYLSMIAIILIVLDAWRRRRTTPK
jgi:hypothetical protein